MVLLGQTATPFKGEENKILNYLGGVTLHSNGAGRGGSGCPISPFNLLTAAHVWENTEKAGDLSVIGETFNGIKVIPTSLRWRHPKEDVDIAILAIPEDGFSFAKWFTQRKKLPSLGEKLKMPLSNPTVRNGIIYGNLAWEEEGVLFLDMSGFPGVSGSCILNEKDELIGIVSGVWSHPDIPMRPFMRIIPVREVR